MSLLGMNCFISIAVWVYFRRFLEAARPSPTHPQRKRNVLPSFVTKISLFFPKGEREFTKIRNPPQTPKCLFLILSQVVEFSFDFQLWGPGLQRPLVKGFLTFPDDT